MPRVLAVLAMLTAAGCATTNPRPAFDAMGRTIRERSGADLSWARSPEESATVRAAVEALLAKEITADTAVQVALLTNPSLQATFEDLGVAAADRAQAARLANPEIDLEAVPPSSGISRGSIAQDVFDIFLQPARKRLSTVELEQTKLRVGDQVLDLAAETRTAFYTLQAREQLVSRLKLILEINRAAADLAARQHAAGNINDLDLANQTTAYEEMRVAVARAQSDSRRDRERMNRLMGLWGAYTDWKVADRLPSIPADEAPLDHLESMAIRDRLDVGAARFGVDLVGRALALRKGTRFFPVGVKVGVETERQSGEKRLVGPKLALQLPIFDMGGASVARLEAQRRQAQWQLEAIAVNARSEVRESRDMLVAARDEALFYRDVLLPQRVHVIDLTLREYNMMLKGTYDVLAARRSEVETERSYIEAWRDYWLARTALERAVGGRLVASAGRQSVEHSEGANQ
jgi:cobalt-zinc-cadmium efflux system outer membrane protein